MIKFAASCKRLLILSFAFCAFLFTASWAVSVAATEPSVEEMVDALAEKKAAEPVPSGVRMRSLGSNKSASTAGQLQLSVQFEFASSTISAESRDLLIKLV